MLRYEIDIFRQQDLHVAIGSTIGAPGPALGATESAHAKCHQRGAIRKIDARPIPTLSFAVQVFARPFMIEPGFTRHLVGGAGADDGTADAQMRNAVVITRGV